MRITYYLYYKTYPTYILFFSIFMEEFKNILYIKISIQLRKRTRKQNIIYPIN